MSWHPFLSCTTVATANPSSQGTHSQSSDAAALLIYLMASPIIGTVIEFALADDPHSFETGRCHRHNMRPKTYHASVTALGRVTGVFHLSTED